MSELYDRVIKALQVAAKRSENVPGHAHEGYHQWLILHPIDYAALQNELGSPAECQTLQTPGTWLLGVDVICDEDANLGVVKLRTDEYY